MLVVGYMGDLIREYVDAHYPHLEGVVRRAARALGPGPRGLAGSRRSWRAAIRLLIVLGDTIFAADFAGARRAARTAGSGSRRSRTRAASASSRSKDGCVVRLVEKPEPPDLEPGDRRHLLLHRHAGCCSTRSTSWSQKDLRTKGEYQLTDALQLMLERGRRIRHVPGRRLVRLRQDRDAARDQPRPAGAQAVRRDPSSRRRAR